WGFLNGTSVDTTNVFVDGLSQWLDDGSQVTTVGGQTRTDIGPAAGTVGGGNAYLNNINGTVMLPTINTAIGKSWFQPQRVDTIAMGPDVFMYLLNKIQ